MKTNNQSTRATLAVALAIFSSTAAMGETIPVVAETSPEIRVETPAPTELIQVEQIKQVEQTNKAEQAKQAEQPNKPERKWMDELSNRIQLHGYAQGGYNYTHKGDADDNTFELKRVLFWANAQITDRWSFLFMHDFSSVVQEFYTDYRITRNNALNVRLGQFKNGLSLENPLSPTSMEAIDVYSEGVTFLSGCGSDPLYGVQYGRDLGLSLFGLTNNGRLRYEVQVMNGQGINKKDRNNFKDIIGRIEYRPTKGLNLVATGQYGRGNSILAQGQTSVYNPTILSGQNYKRHRWTAGFSYRSQQFSLHGEYLEGRDGSVTSRGGYLTGSVPLGNPKVELVGSYDFFNYNTRLDMDQHKAIVGVQYWFYGKCRLQLQYVYKSAFVAGNQFIHDNSHAIMCQMQVRFN